MIESPPSEPDWDYVIDEVLPRLGMWTGRETYERAVFFLEGFDLARNGRLHALMTEWARERYGATNHGWPWVLIYIALESPRDALNDLDMGRLTAEEDRVVLGLFKEAIRDIAPALRGESS